VVESYDAEKVEQYERIAACVNACALIDFTETPRVVIFPLAKNYPFSVEEAKKRMTNCTNACAGLNPAGIPGLVEAVDVYKCEREVFDNPPQSHSERVMFTALAAVKEKT
jgi:hypothetical protein